jgi:N-carbamoyl-L-amino-acid hydrolase
LSAKKVSAKKVSVKQASAHTITINQDRISERLDHLASLTDPAVPYTRRAFTERYKEARGWLEHQFQQANLTPRYDAAANLIGRREGSQALPTIALGSHIDTVTGGGRFDGTAGVIVGLEIAQALAEAGVTLEHPLEIIDFISEEVSDYAAASCVGSRALSNTLSDAMLAGENPDGETLADAINRMGGRASNITQTKQFDYAGYMELHIEQGLVLESQAIPLGVVTGIVTIRRFELRVLGQPDHAGTTPMALRRDALVGAAWLIRRVRDLAAARDDVVATAGRMFNHPNGANVIPGEVVLNLEIRALEESLIDQLYEQLLADAAPVLEEDGLTLEHRQLSNAPGIRCAEPIQDALEQAAHTRGYASLKLPSGAGHDAMHMASICPVGMVFIRSIGGRSHTPDEQSRPEDLRAAAEVILGALLTLDKQTQQT